MPKIRINKWLASTNLVPTPHLLTKLVEEADKKQEEWSFEGFLEMEYSGFISRWRKF